MALVSFMNKKEKKINLLNDEFIEYLFEDGYFKRRFDFIFSLFVVYSAYMFFKLIVVTFAVYSVSIFSSFTIFQIFLDKISLFIQLGILPLVLVKLSFKPIEFVIRNTYFLNKSFCSRRVRKFIEKSDVVNKIILDNHISNPTVIKEFKKIIGDEVIKDKFIFLNYMKESEDIGLRISDFSVSNYSKKVFK